ncbi:hypothetical protein BAZSYMB_GCONTIG00702_1 [Bathymodiolus azoricus thioautotrophic gill symbiont]|uniref:Uncharacterized protein n=1 Tax=Bathymodiolus azoricus thioautotrophic gill symbiont TaxID=235205 RepID=A0A1H6LT37_9GAMM|nr:hypothetical protein BAZSYMB_GCONTIG00702_1 [Bathymodiolus azoricus thioautotrophic gill symbiont]
MKFCVILKDVAGTILADAANDTSTVESRSNFNIA